MSKNQNTYLVLDFSHNILTSAHILACFASLSYY